MPSGASRYRALEAGELKITFDLYERIIDLCGWRRKAQRRGDLASGDLMTYLLATSADRARIIGN